MARDFPGLVSPASGSKGTTLASPSPMGPALGARGRGNKEIAPVLASNGPGAVAKTSKMTGFSVPSKHGTEYGQVTG